MWMACHDLYSSRLLIPFGKCVCNLFCQKISRRCKVSSFFFLSKDVFIAFAKPILFDYCEFCVLTEVAVGRPFCVMFGNHARHVLLLDVRAMVIKADSEWCFTFTDILFLTIFTIHKVDDPI